MQELQTIQNYQPLAKSQWAVDLTYIPNPSYTYTSHISGPTMVFISAEHTELPALTEYRLIYTGRLLAVMLAHTLDQLKNYNKGAIHPIVSFIEPYKNVNQELYAHMPPKASREVTIEVTRRGKAKPRASLD